MAKLKVPASFESLRFEMRLYKSHDYAQWKKAHESMLPKQNEFDQDLKKPSETTRAAFQKFLKQNRDFEKKGVIYQYGIFEKKTGRLMGFVLIGLVLRFNVQSARLSYAVFNNYWKHGYGREAVAATIQFAFSKMKLHRIEAEILPHNRASIALVKGLGFQFEGIRRGAVFFQRKWHDHSIFALLAEDVGMKKVKPEVFT